MADSPPLLHENEQDRTVFLRDLVASLTPAERDLVFALITRHKDIFANLPTELIDKILSHFLLSEIWTVLPLVCKRWQKILSSEELLRSALRRQWHWDTHDPSDSARPHSSLSSPKAILRHIEAVKQGRAFTMSSILRSRGAAIAGSFKIPGASVSLKGSRIAYLDADSEGMGMLVKVVDFGTNQTMSFRGTARENIMTVVLSSKVVAFMTYTGKLYVADLQGATDQPREYRLPSADIIAVCADEDLVAIMFAQRPHGPSTVVVFESTTGRSKDFTVPWAQAHGTTDSTNNPDNWATPRTILLSSRKRCVDIFSQTSILVSEIDDDHLLGEHKYVEHRRYSLEGGELCKSSWHFKGPYLKSQRSSLGDPYSSGRAGQCLFQSKPLLRGKTHSYPSQPQSEYADSNRLDRVLIGFDAKSGKLQEYIAVPKWMKRDHLPYYPNLENPSSWAIWKDVLYRTMSAGSVVITEKIPNDQGDRGRHESRYQGREVVSGAWGHKVSSSLSEPVKILVNDSFLVAFSDGTSPHINVFCFEEGLEWTGSQPTGLWDSCPLPELVRVKNSSINEV